MLRHVCAKEKIIATSAGRRNVICNRHDVEVERRRGSHPLDTGVAKMRVVAAAVLCAALGGCWTSGQETASNRSGDQFVGQNVEVVASRFGQPMGRKRMDNDQMLYVWELAPADPSARRRTTDTGQGGLYGDGHTPGYMSDDPRICKLSVTTSPEGIVTQFDAEDSNGTGAPARTLGLVGSVCAQRL